MAGFVFASNALVGTFAVAQSSPRVGLVLPGVSVAGVNLGGSASSFEAAFPKGPAAKDHALSGTFGEGCPQEVYYWSDLAFDPSGVTAYLKDSEISQISVQGRKFYLPDGLRTGATEGQAERAFPTGQLYVLVNSDTKVNGGRNLNYWVDERNGIAFELAWWQTKRQRLVNKIDIFPKQAKYRPGGCVSAPQEWREKPSNKISQ